MDLLERSDELATLDRLLAECAAGGRVALVSGEAGAGKSSLATAFARAAGPRAQVLWGACDPLLTPRALGPLHDIARGLGGRLREVLRDRQTGGPRGEVFDLFLEALDRPPQAARPVVVLEDLHWADEATLDMVAFVGRRLALCRALLLLTYRDEEIGPDHRLRAVLAGLPRGLARRVSLPPLSRQAVAELAQRAGRSSPDVYAVTGGNPLLVSEVLAAPAEGVPPTVRDLVLSRLATLSEPARELARLVSVVPAQAPVDLLGDRLAAVDECLAAGMLAAAGDGVAFRHELLRLAVEESLSPVRRVALHAEVLAALAGHEGVDPARLVHHAHHAGDAAAVLHWAPVAAERAAALGAYRQAAAHYAVAVPLAADRPAGERAELLAAYSLAGYHGGLDSAEVLAAREAALTLRTELGDPVRIGEDLRWASRLSWWHGRTDEAWRHGHRAVEVLETAPPGPELAAAYSNLSQLFMLAIDYPAAIGWGTRAVELARRIGDLNAELHALVNIATSRQHQGDPTGAEELRRLHDRAAAAGLDDHAARALVNLATVAADQYDFDLAESVMERTVPFLVSRDLDGYLRHLLGHRARVELIRGDWPAARADVGQALAGPMTGAGQVPALAVRATLRARLGEEDAYADARLAADLGYRIGEIQFAGPAAIALAEIHWLDGDVELAAEEARRGLALADRVGHRWFRSELAFWLWRCGGDPRNAEGTPYELLIAGEWRAAA
ncbi:ATP-binding protein, partial [Paractinoplanes rishiriensis]|uniref:ATP-binding protein n=1 Tax=Paractinoplanes rishiriensis TaxID=1050105 RepID=UPI00194233C4